MSSNGQYVAYVEWAYPDAADSASATAAAGDVRVYNAASPDSTVPTSLGTAYDASLTVTGLNAAELESAILAPTVMSANGQIIGWDGSSITNVTNDNNNTLDVFLVNQTPAPTALTLTTLVVPDLNSTTVGQFQTTATPSERTRSSTRSSPAPATRTTHSSPSAATTSLHPRPLSHNLPPTLKALISSILAQTTDELAASSFLTQQFTLDVIQAANGPQHLAVAGAERS